MFMRIRLFEEGSLLINMRVVQRTFIWELFWAVKAIPMGIEASADGSPLQKTHWATAGTMAPLWPWLLYLSNLGPFGILLKGQNTAKHSQSYEWILLEQP
jgi:hypothetical protein